MSMGVPATRDSVLQRVDRSGGPGTCWPWQGYLHPSGYGRVYAEGRAYQAHVLVYRLLVGPIPAGLELDHRCRNKQCCNPAHLEPVTHAENSRRGPRRPVAACQNGHAYDEANTARSGGRRVCRACSRVKTARYRARRVQAAA